MGTNFELTGRVKNTFLYFREEDCESDVDQRPSSEPGSPTSSRSSWSHLVDSSNSCIYRFRGETALKQPVCSLMNTGGKVAKNDDQEPSGQDDSTEQSTVKKFKRPCKAQRERFSKYVDSLKSKVDADPEGFTLDNINIPKKLVHGERGFKKIATVLGDYRTKILSNGTESQQVTDVGCRGEGLPCNPDTVSLSCDRSSCFQMKSVASRNLEI